MNEKSEKVGGGGEKPPSSSVSGMDHQGQDNAKQCYYPQVISYLWGGRNNGEVGGEGGDNASDTAGIYTYSKRYYGGGGSSSSVTRVVLWVVTLSIVGLLGQRVYNLEQRLSQVEGQLLLILSQTTTSSAADAAMRFADSSHFLFNTNQNIHRDNNNFVDKLEKISGSFNNNNNIRLVRRGGGSGEIGGGISEFISEDGASVGHPMLRFRREANPQHNSKEDQDLIDNVILASGGSANSASGGGGGPGGGGSIDMSHCPCTQGKLVTYVVVLYIVCITYS